MLSVKRFQWKRTKFQSHFRAIMLAQEEVFTLPRETANINKMCGITQILILSLLQ
jgi:hypothetical protein